MLTQQPIYHKDYEWLIAKSGDWKIMFSNSKIRNIFNPILKI